MKNRIFSLLFALLLAGSLSVTAFAHEVPNLDQNGTVTFTVDYNGEPLNSGSMSMYRVGDIVEKDGNYSFALIAELSDSGLSLTEIGSPQLAAELAAKAKEKQLPELSASIREGQACFTDVVPGLYVVVQEEADAADGFAPMTPFLISMPRYENGHYETEVIADPKVNLETQPTEPPSTEPTDPDDPKLPQTGQLNWPIPVLTVSGIALFALGWFLRFGQKKEQYEK